MQIDGAIEATGGLRFSDRWWLGMFCLVVFGYSMVGGRPLTLHEAVLPQSSREMLADGDLVVPKSGGRPWLERPPLPQWITVATTATLGVTDQEWAFRLPSALAGLIIVLLTADLAGRLMGRTVGLLSGLMLATMQEIVHYSRLAEQDIYLGAVVTASVYLFGRLEVSRDWSPTSADRPANVAFWGPRSWGMLLLFTLLGATNLAKGLIFGTAMAVIPMGAFLLWNADIRRILQYFWLWGWLLFVGIAVAWPIAAYAKYPDVLELWYFDLMGRLDDSYKIISQPFWYYPVNLLWEAAPWTPAVLVGLAAITPAAFRKSASPERFFWGWAVITMAVFSLPSGKHHHYLVQCLAPWSVLGAVGLQTIWGWLLQMPAIIKQPAVGIPLLVVPVVAAVAMWGSLIPGPQWALLLLVVGWIAGASCYVLGLQQRRPQLAMAGVIGFVVLGHAWGYSVVAPITDLTLQDTAFLKQVRERLQDERTGKQATPLFVNADVNSMDIFRILFYLGDKVEPTAIHNLTFLRDEQIAADTIYVLTRASDKEKLATLGDVDQLLQSEYTRREVTPADRYTLFRMKYYPNVARAPGAERVSPMQAMSRAEGPYILGRL